MAVEEGHFREEEAGIPGEKRLLEEINVPEGIRLVSTESLADVLVAPLPMGRDVFLPASEGVCHRNRL